MSLRAFHLLFIALSIVLAAFLAAWAAGQYRVDAGAQYALVALGSLALAVGLAVYAAKFQRKTRYL